jgi:hypothetical protein
MFPAYFADQRRSNSYYLRKRAYRQAGLQDQREDLKMPALSTSTEKEGKPN